MSAPEANDDGKVPRQQVSAYFRLLSHDLNSPLGAIRILSELLVSELEDPQLEEDASDVLEAADSAGALLEGTGALMRLFDPKPLVSQPVDLGALAQDLARRPSMRKGVEIDGTASVMGDQEAIRQALLDIAVTGRRLSSRDEGIVLEIAARGEAVEVRCVYAGRRLDDEEWALLLQPFGTLALRQERISVPPQGLAYAAWLAGQAGGSLVLEREQDDRHAIVMTLG